jgi:GT2 family glycosyltransferase
MKLKVSVIMAVRNDAINVRKSILSTLDDISLDDEIIIVDDASSDDSAFIVKDIVTSDERVTLITNQKNIGLAASLNIAAFKAKNELLCRMDSDDINIKGRIGALRKLFEENNELSVAGTNAFTFNKSISQREGIIRTPTRHNEIVTSLLFDSPMVHPSVAIRKTTFEEVGGYNEDYARCQDYELWCRMVKNGSIMQNLNIIGLGYRVSSSGNKEKIATRFTYTTPIRDQYLRVVHGVSSKESRQAHCFLCGDLTLVDYFTFTSVHSLVGMYSEILDELNNRCFFKGVLRKAIKRISTKPVVSSYLVFKLIILFIKKGI